MWIEGIALAIFGTLALVVDPPSLIRTLSQWAAVVLAVALVLGGVILWADRGHDANIEAKMRRRDEIDRGVRSDE